MARGTPENPSEPAEESASERLDSWKEIAAYLKRDIRTVRRWEQAEQLPVHRHLHDKRGTVYAYRAEVDAWWNSGRSRLEQTHPTLTAARKQHLALWAGAVLLMIALGAAIYAAWQRISQPSPPAGRIMLAVLPFDNLSGDPDQEFLSDGITEEMITQLGRMKPEQLGVIARSSVMRYKHGERQLEQIRKELGVQYILEGSVRRAGNRVRISAQLIRATDQTHLWAQEYDRDLWDTLALQSEVAGEIAREIRLELTPQERARLVPAAPLNPAAYEAYLKGNFSLHKNTAEGDRKALEYFQKALEFDPGFALGYAGLARAHMTLGNNSIVPTGEAYPRARAAAGKALELDDTLAETHLELAVLKHLYEWDQTGAEREFKRALELNPNSADAHLGYSYYLIHQLRCDEATAEAEAARRLNPASLGVSVTLGITFFCARRYDQAIAQYGSVLEVEPSNFFARFWRGWAYLGKGSNEQAIADSQRLISQGDFPESNALSELGVGYGQAGKKTEALRILEDLKQKRTRAYGRPWMIASICAALGDKNQAMEWLEKGYEERDDWLLWNRVYPGFESLRSDPHFQDLSRRVGLPQ